MTVHVLSVTDPHYPAALRAIPDPPARLYVRGNLDALAAVSGAVVGTRAASARGLAAARSIGQCLAQQRITVVSGLALGIDTAAHQGALAGRGLTVAVLAHGLDSIYPAQNRGLAEAILSAGGALVSEHGPGVSPRPGHFVRRNRIQSGLSRFSIVVESDIQGGAMHQARFTVQQGRPLYTVLPETSAEGFNPAGGREWVRRFGGRGAQ